MQTAVQLFGPLTVRTRGREISIKRRQLRSVLAMLALTPRVAVSTDRLIDGLWEKRLPADATHALHVYISRLRGVDASLREAIVTQPYAYELDLPRDNIDILKFEKLVNAARGSKADAESMAVEALSLWHGIPFLGFQYEEFVQTPIRRLNRLRRDAVVFGSQGGLSGGSATSWIPLLEDVVATDPHDSVAWEALASCYENAGDPKRAADARWRMASIEQHPRVVADTSTWDLQKRSTPVTPFIGRDDDLEELAGLAASELLVTIVGLAGVGKTRLAEEFAAQVELPVHVAYLRDHTTLAAAIGAAFRIPILPGDPTIESLAKFTAGHEGLLLLDDCDKDADVVAEYAVHARRYAPGLRLLVTSRAPLQAPDEVVFRLGGLSTAFAGEDELSDAGRMLSTQLRHVELLSWPQINHIAGKLDGVPLALEITGASMAQMSAEQILMRVSDPLALTTKSRLRGVRPDHQTLKEALDASYATISDSARLAMHRVGRFCSSFTAADAAFVVPELESGVVLNSLGELVHHSLLSHDSGRYRMLWVVAAFARTLEGLGESQSQHLHSKWVMDRLTALAPATLTAAALSAHTSLDEISRDIDAALEYGFRESRELPSRLASLLAWHWHVRGLWSQRAALALRIFRTSQSAHPNDRLGAACALMILQFDLRQMDAALQTAETIRELATESDPLSWAVLAEAMTAAIHSTSGRTKEGLASAQKARTLAESLDEPFPLCVAWFAEVSLCLHGDAHAQAIGLCEKINALPNAEPLIWASATFVLAWDARERGDLDRAQQLIDAASPIQDELNEPLFRPLTHLERALIHLELGRPVAAARILVPIAEQVIRRGDAMVSIPVLNGLASIAYHLGESVLAVTISSASESRNRAVGWTVNPWVTTDMAALDRELRRSISQKTHARAEALGASISDPDLLSLVRATLNSKANRTG